MRGFMRIGGAVLAAGCASWATTATATAAQVPVMSGTCASSQIIQIEALVFQPPAVAPGQLSQATMSAVNCTAQSQQAGVEWLGRFVGSTPGIPPGCPAIDPLYLPLNFPSDGRLTSSVGYLVTRPCTASALVVTAKILQNGTTVAQRSAQLTIEQPPSASGG